MPSSRELVTKGSFLGPRIGKPLPLRPYEVKYRLFFQNNLKVSCVIESMDAIQYQASSWWAIELYVDLRIDIIV